MTTVRMIWMTLFAAFSGLLVLAYTRYKSVALLLYILGLVSFANSYRKLNSKTAAIPGDPDHLEDRLKEMPDSPSRKDHSRVLVIGMCACLLLILVTIINCESQ